MAETWTPIPFGGLELFEWSDTPMWVFDLARRRMAWANAAGVATQTSASSAMNMTSTNPLRMVPPPWC